MENTAAFWSESSYNPAAVGGAMFEETDSLIARLKRGDDGAFFSLVEAHSRALLRVARRFMKVEEDAHDAVQETFISIFRAVSKFDGTSQLSTWMHRILVNHCLMKLRGQRRRPDQGCARVPLEASLPARSSTADADYESRERSRQVRESIAQLPRTHREILVARELDEWSTAETARRLGISENAVKIRLHRARSALRELLEPVN